MECIYLNPILETDSNNDSSLYEKVQKKGLNTGNMVFVDAIKKQIKYKREDWLNNESLNELDIENIGIISCANMINVNDSFLDTRERAICDLKFPVTLVGIGAQSTAELDTPQKLMTAMPKERIVALHRICDKVVSIGVRGEFTAECLEVVGIKNYRVIGCPSLYNYEKDFRKIKLPNADKCVFNTATGIKREHKVIQIGMQKSMKWIMQTMAEMPRTVYENCELTEELVQRKFPGYFGDIISLKNYMKNNAIMFFTMSEWYSYMEEEAFTFSFGGRFHGNVVALRSGIPALWIIHDSRTRELTELFHLPSIEFPELDKINCVEDLLEYCSYDKFYKTYPIMFNEYIKFLEENRIDHIWK
ncbi:MAG: polysaccharide pyruvyl transferase family protein [Anaerocolumna sp.]